MLRALVMRNRSYRRFDPSCKIPLETLTEFVDLVRQTPSSANLQPLKYFLSADEETNSRIFPHLAWAGYLKEWPGPAEGERPVAYMVVLGDTSISKKFDRDLGIAAQTILLGAVDRGFGGCMIGSIKKQALRNSLEIPARYEILLVIALGKPAEEVRIEHLNAEGDIKYWRDADGVHHVPKRPMNDLIYKEDPETCP